MAPAYSTCVAVFDWFLEHFRAFLYAKMAFHGDSVVISVHEHYAWAELGRPERSRERETGIGGTLIYVEQALLRGA